MSAQRSLRRLLACSLVALLAAPFAFAGKVDEIEPGKFLLVGALDSAAAAGAAAIPEGSQLTVFAWGHSDEAWFTAVEMSNRFQARNVKVVLEYAEDAAISIFGAKTAIEGKILADSRVPSFDHDGMQRVASAIERFQLVCGAKIPDEAPAKSPVGLAGFTHDKEESKGKRAMPNQRWFFERMGEHDKGKWKHDEVEKVVKKCDTLRKSAERQEKNLRRAAEDRKRKTDKPADKR